MTEKDSAEPGKEKEQSAKKTEKNTSDRNLHKAEKNMMKQEDSQPQRSSGKSSRHGARPNVNSDEVEKVRRNLSNMGQEERRQRILKQQRIR